MHCTFKDAAHRKQVIRFLNTYAYPLTLRKKKKKRIFFNYFNFPGESFLRNEFLLVNLRYHFHSKLPMLLYQLKDYDSDF